MNKYKHLQFVLEVLLLKHKIKNNCIEFKLHLGLLQRVQVLEKCEHLKEKILIDYIAATTLATTTIIPSAETQSLYDTLSNLKKALQLFLVIDPADQNIIDAIAALDQAIAFISNVFSE